MSVSDRLRADILTRAKLTSEDITLVMNATDHEITAALADDGMYIANCTCGWHSASASAALRNWNVEGHRDDIAGVPPSVITHITP